MIGKVWMINHTSRSFSAISRQVGISLIATCPGSDILSAGALRAQLAARQPKRTPGPSSQVAGGADAGASKRKREDGDVIDVTSSEDSEEVSIWIRRLSQAS